MDIQRDKLQDLINWKNKSNRKPLILNGARQVGKSWLVSKLGEIAFSGNILTINFEKRREVHQVFKKNLVPERIILELGLILDTNIEIGSTLLFFDEIQECPEALMSLRYFYEEMPKLHLIAAGSLLDFSFSEYPYPVGRVETLDIFPISFFEFIKAKSPKNSAYRLLLDKNFEIPESLLDKLESEYLEYIIVGGMPASVKYYLETKDFIGVKKIQDDLLYTYEQDFKKYKPQIDEDCLKDVLKNSIQFIGNQIIYTKLSDRFSGPTIKKAHELLKTARLIHSVENVSVSRLPLAVSGKRFKTFYLDIGLMVRKNGLDARNIYLTTDLYATFQGELAEQFVAQQLVSNLGLELYYWAREEGSASAEVDFVIAKDGEIIPIEVKAGKSTKIKSLVNLLESYPNIKKAIVYSTNNQKAEGKIEYIPIYLAGMRI
ncbi:MAG: ATP-binding protein [Bacteroidetes bacterium]|jgi:predicted AAA+ superfamily ATPase|nr:ATP-binding protein [Bacteroidota bacterium]